MRPIHSRLQCCSLKHAREKPLRTGSIVGQLLAKHANIQMIEAYQQSSGSFAVSPTSMVGVACAQVYNMVHIRPVSKHNGRKARCPYAFQQGMFTLCDTHCTALRRTFAERVNE